MSLLIRMKLVKKFENALKRVENAFLVRRKRFKQRDRKRYAIVSVTRS
jgi:hypothetical protein